MLTVYLLAVLLLITVIIVAGIDYQLKTYRWKAGKRYRRHYIPVAGVDYVLWLPEEKRKRRK